MLKLIARTLELFALSSSVPLLNIKVANLNQFLELNVLLFLIFICAKIYVLFMYYFNTKHVIKKIITSVSLTSS